MKILFKDEGDTGEILTQDCDDAKITGKPEQLRLTIMAKCLMCVMNL